MGTVVPATETQTAQSSHFPDWIAAFCALLEDHRAPPLFAKWAGAFAIGAAVQRKMWLLSLGEEIFPNFYIFLCGASGVGKGVALNPLYRILSQVEGQHLAPASITAAALADKLEEADVSVVTPAGDQYQYNSLTVISRELSVFIPAYDVIMMSMLTDVWDNMGYSESRRGRHKDIDLPGAQLSIIAGTTPTTLNNKLPEGAWGEGFMSRVILVFGQEMPVKPLTEELDYNRDDGYLPFISDLNRIAARTGRMRWQADALAALNAWYTSGKKPVPSHPKLLTYNIRRHYNLMKLSMCFALGRSHEKIELEDFEDALDMVRETESLMPEAFKAMRSGGDMSAIEEVWHMTYQKYMKNDRRPVPKSFVVRAFQERVPSYAIPRIIEAMIGGNLFKLHEIKGIGEAFEPVKNEF